MGSRPMKRKEKIHQMIIIIINSIMSKINCQFSLVFCHFFQRGFVSGSGDSTVKFWQFELVSDADHSQVR